MASTSIFVLAPDFPQLEGLEMLGGPYEESLRTAKRLGYDGVEIILGDPACFDMATFTALLEKYELKVSAINSGGIEYLFKTSLVNADEAKMASALEKLKSSIRCCQRLGCIQQVGVARGGAVPGRPMRWFKACLVEVLSEAARHAAEYGVFLVLEYTNRLEINTINTAAEAREIVERVGSSNLGILMDTYHSYLEDPDVYRTILDLKDYIRHFHLHDSNQGAAIIGGGANDFECIMRMCGQIGYHNWFSDGLMTLKYSEDEIRYSTTALRKLYEKYGL
ncbi:MAG: sugar phosphate isomerase/epimerase [Acidobacteria bacterium]|nr:sugar phosphate isomerase/epimerase [Acidobacteriota bacterium]